jgi:dephospho-CoA kinase
MIKLGLTGGIATGKSTVSEHLGSLGFPIIDADLIARQVVAAGTTGLTQIVDAFGEDILLADGSLNRQALGKRVFGHPEELEKLNDITHPLVQNESQRLVAQYREAGERLIILDIPLLLEGKNKAGADKIMVVTTPAKVQLQRLMARNQLSESDALARINSQMPLSEKEALADYVIDNSGSLANTFAQVDAALKTMLP